MSRDFFSVNLAGRELPKCVSTYRKQIRFRTQKSRKCTHTFFMKLARAKRPKSVWISRQTLRFWTQKWWKCAQKSFCKPWIRRTSKMRLNFTANSFVFGRKNGENAPRNLFVNPEFGELSNCVWTSRQTAPFLDAKIVIMRPELSL